MTAKDANLEQELKFRVADTFALPYLGGGGLRHVVVGRRTLDATYWDTPDLRLARRGHTLRFRTSDDGSERKWTLKLAGRGGSSLMQRREVDRAGEPDSPPPALVQALVGITDRRELVAVAQLRSRENQYRIEDSQGRHLLTVEDDRVQLIERERIRGSLREVEVEVNDPSRGRRALARTTRRLRDAGAGKPDPTSKLEHAMGSLAHERAPRLRRSSTVEELIRYTVRDGLDQLLRHDPGVRLDLGSEDVHQARIATRRLRANLRTLRPLLAHEQIDSLRDEIVWAGRLLGEVRDLDVLRGVFADALEAEPQLDATAFLAVVDTERSAAHRCLVVAMATARWQSMLDTLGAAAVLPPLGPAIAPTSSARSVIRPLLHKSWRRLERRADSAEENGTSWHDVRKSAKSLRYASELFKPFLGAAAKPLAKASERIQTQLGMDQDSLVARDWLAHHAGDERIGASVRKLADHFDDPRDRQPPHWKSLWKRARRAAEPIA